MVVKLRPFVREFLEEVNKMFNLYIYTMGSRNYATKVAKILDPEDKYFPSKVISRAGFTRRNQKALSAVPGYSQACTIILDDKLSVCFSYISLCFLFLH
jgi:FCP1-like phosphatase family protein